MNAVPWGDGGPPGSWRADAPAAPARRLVAVTVTEADVLEERSDLRQLLSTTSDVDVLVVRRDPPEPVAGPAPVDAEDYPDDDEEPGAAPVEVPAAVAPDGVRLHRLGLRWTVRDVAEPDLVAAMSELVGFDPEAGVFCVSPRSGDDPVSDPEVVVVRRAVRRVARVYGLPVLHYRPLAEAVVGQADVPGRPAVCGSAG